MSKSLGNVVSPVDVINKMGADILRLWATASDYTGDINFSDEILKRNTDAYRRIRNTARFLLSNLDDFDFAATPFKPHVAASQEELQAILHTHVEAALFSLSTATDDDFNRTWTIRRGELVVATLVKKAAVRSWGFSHTYHHRGQLSVYLRLLNIPVPGMYGPSADER